MLIEFAEGMFVNVWEMVVNVCDAPSEHLLDVFWRTSALVMNQISSLFCYFTVLVDGEMLIMLLYLGS